MKTKLLGTVLILAMCSSCETADETFAIETPDNYRDKETTKAYTTNSAKSSDYQTYKNIVSSFVYDNDQSYAQNIDRFEAHVNQLIADKTASYEAIDKEQLELLTAANENFIDELDYSTTFKAALYELVYMDMQFVPMLNSPTESNLLNTLFEMYNDDDKQNGNRTIAFAYGAQYNLTQAILYAGAVELRR